MKIFKMLIVLMFLATSCFATDYAHKGYVNDYANVIDDAVEAKMELMLADYVKDTVNEIAVVTVPSLDGQDIDSFTLNLAQKWGVGKKGVDNGVMILVAPNDRKWRIEVGYGLEHVLTDIAAGRIGDNIMVPHFKKGDFTQGIVAGLDEVASQTKNVTETRAAYDARAAADRERATEGFLFVMQCFVGLGGLGLLFVGLYHLFIFSRKVLSAKAKNIAHLDLILDIYNNRIVALDKYTLELPQIGEVCQVTFDELLEKTKNERNFLLGQFRSIELRKDSCIMSGHWKNHKDHDAIMSIGHNLGESQSYPSVTTVAHAKAKLRGYIQDIADRKRAIQEYLALNPESTKGLDKGSFGTFSEYIPRGKGVVKQSDNADTDRKKLIDALASMRSTTKNYEQVKAEGTKMIAQVEREFGNLHISNRSDSKIRSLQGDFTTTIKKANCLFGEKRYLDTHVAINLASKFIDDIKKRDRKIKEEEEEEDRRRRRNNDSYYGGSSSSTGSGSDSSSSFGGGSFGGGGSSGSW